MRTARRPAGVKRAEDEVRDADPLGALLAGAAEATGDGPLKDWLVKLLAAPTSGAVEPRAGDTAAVAKVSRGAT